jgi:hypothetical protein
MIKAIFVRGDISFEVDGHPIKFEQLHLSPWGVSGLPWNSTGRGGLDGAVLSPTDHFGRAVDISFFSRHGNEEIRFRAPGLIVREFTAVSEAMGIRFNLAPEDRRALSAYIQKFGYIPTDYLRKYPRIPSSQLIQTFPIRARVMPSSLGPEFPPEAPIVFDVCNLSPAGVLLSTENQLSLMIRAGERLAMVLEPRGLFTTPIEFQGLVCRLTDDLEPLSGNLTRYLGVKIARMTETNRTAFLELLSDILERLRKRP